MTGIWLLITRCAATTLHIAEVEHETCQIFTACTNVGSRAGVIVSLSQSVMLLGGVGVETEGLFPLNTSRKLRISTEIVYCAAHSSAYQRNCTAGWVCCG
jgi:hypothetical protein